MAATTTATKVNCIQYKTTTVNLMIAYSNVNGEIKFYFVVPLKPLFFIVERCRFPAMITLPIKTTQVFSIYFAIKLLNAGGIT